ncbi:hypothetical protein ACGFZG_08710 [Streptomyces antibioticus]|uniref:hypothetical protein n=1 Tax=Streptomyces antibioticus TaxID=1890 RepID=UPI0037172613
MTGKKEAGPEAGEPSRAAGVCVLVVLGGVVVGVLFAVDEAVGVLAVVGVGWVALYCSARRMPGLSAPPPPPPGTTVLAGETGEIARVQKGPGEGMTILYPVREETPEE